MRSLEVPQPILNSPYEEPREHWWIVGGEPPERRPGRRPPIYWYRPAGAENGSAPDRESAGTAIELKLVTRIRGLVKAWRGEGWPGVTRTTQELLKYWRQEGRRWPLFFAQLDAVETMVFLTEARADFLQGIEIPRDEPTERQKAEGFTAFRRYACKMATGSGKTTVMGMLAAWSILNKVNDRADGRFSDVVLIVCPNVTIRSRLSELNPETGEASLYRTRDVVPPHLMPDLCKGRVLVTNWHVFEPQVMQVGGVSAKVAKTGRRVTIREKISIGAKTTTARGTRYLSPEDYEKQLAAGMLRLLEEMRDRQGNLMRVIVESEKFVESDTALLNRVLGREIGSRQNILVFNDEAHHAYRIRGEEPPEEEAGEDDEFEELVADAREATVWVEGLDRIHKLRGINYCVDLSATPYFLSRMGPMTNRPFPWVVSDFGLTDAIESGLVKIPQFAVRDTTGAEIPGYFNIWRWILPRLTPSERGGRKGTVKPEAILKWSNTPIAMLAGVWEQLRREWETRSQDPRPPVFILVCNNTKVARLVYEWLALDQPPPGIPSAKIEGLRNVGGREVTIRVDSRVVQETDSDNAKSDEFRWMRHTLDTVGKIGWPRDRQERPIYPGGFTELAEKLGRPLHPPGRDVRCIVSVGMLTEGWDCSTVTHIVGLRPFMSQLLCEQVVGRGLRRTNYEVGPDGKMTEEVAQILGVPFQVIPFKQSEGGGAAVQVERHHVHAIPERAALEIRFPRVEGYRQAVRNRIRVDWDSVPPLTLDPLNIPPEVEMMAGLPANDGRPTLFGPGKLSEITLNPYRSERRIQELVFEMARDLTRLYRGQPECEAPAHVLFPQIVRIVGTYVGERVRPVRPATRIDAFLAPYYGWMLERLLAAIRPDEGAGEAPELPRIERSRGDGSTGEVDFWTGKEVREVRNSHVNYIVADTKKWEQNAAYRIDRHPAVAAFVKNAGLGFAIPYHHSGEPKDYLPDFVVRLRGEAPRLLILETKGFDPLEEVKSQAADRWVRAVNADGRFGQWSYAVAKSPEVVDEILDAGGR